MSDTDLKSPFQMRSMFRRTVGHNDKHLVAQMIAKSKRDVREYELEINKLKAAMVVLENKRSGLKKTMGQLESLLSPIHRLPPEMLARIFSFCCEKNEVKPVRMPPVFALSVVCGRWREIVLSRPHLWASLSVTYWRWRRHQQASLKNCTEMFMARSKTSPLTIELDFLEDDDEDDIHAPNLETFSALHVLVRHSERWCNVSLVGATPSVLRHAVIQPIRENLPLLQHLRVTEGYSTSIPTGQVLDIFRRCPLLSSIDLQPGAIANALVLPRDQIHRMTMSDAYTTDSLKLLTSTFPTLDRLDLKLNMGDRATRFDGHVTSTNIKQLSLTTFEQEHATRLFDNMTLPHLSSMEIMGLFDKRQRIWERWNQTPLNSFVLRSACLLTHLRLKWLPISGSQAISLLQLIPTLQSLSIEEYTSDRTRRIVLQNQIVTRAFLNRLSVDHGGTALFSSPLFLPKLRDLTLVMNDLGSDEQALATALSSRWLPDTAYAETIGVDCLRSVSITVTGSSASSGEAFSSLKFLRDVGVQLFLDLKS